jgi:hypothetical protein
MAMKAGGSTKIVVIPNALGEITSIPKGLISGRIFFQHMMCSARMTP